MKVSQIALAAVILLLVAAGYLTLQSDMEGRMEDQKKFNAELLSKLEEMKREKPAAAVAPAVPTPPVVPPVVPAATPPTAVASTTPGAPGGAPAPGIIEPDPAMLIRERDLLNPPGGGRIQDETLTVPETAPASLNPVQSRIVALPAIARVTEFNAQLGVVVLSQGSKSGLRPGDSFAIRRATAVIGKLKVGENIEPDQCIADILPGSMPPGMAPIAGDEVIQFDH